jgi:peroxiredoxin
MAAIESEMIPLGSKAPEFSLKDVISGEVKSLPDVRGTHGFVVMFLCAHCPYVKNLQEELGLISKQYQKMGIGFVAIASNDVASYPEDGPEGLREQAMENDFDFPYLLDETQEIAKAYQAVCTPDFFLFDNRDQCVYRGRFDSSTPGNNEPVSGDDLIAAMDALLDGEPVPETQFPSIGCSIKWKTQG